MIIDNLKMNASNSHLNSSEQTISSDADGRISPKKRKLDEASESIQSNEEVAEEEEYSPKRCRLMSESDERLREDQLDSSMVSEQSVASNAETSSEQLEVEGNSQERAVNIVKQNNKDIIKSEQLYSDSSSDSDESIIGKMEAGSKEIIPEAYRESVKFHDELSSSHSSSSSDEDEPHLKVALVRKTQQKIQNMKLKNRKKISKEKTGKKKAGLLSRRRKRNSKSFSDTEDELDLEFQSRRDPVTHYKKLMRAMELRINNYVVFFKDCKDVEAKKNKILDFMNKHGLEDYMKEHGLEGKPPTISICKKVAIKNRIKNEVAELDTGNIISESGRGRRRNVYSLYSSASSPAKQKETKSRITFLDADSSSEGDELQKYVNKFNKKSDESDAKVGENTTNEEAEEKSNGSFGNSYCDKEDIDTNDSDIADSKFQVNDSESDSDDIGSKSRKYESISEGESYKKRSNKVESESEEEEVTDNMEGESLLIEESTVALSAESCNRGEDKVNYRDSGEDYDVNLQNPDVNDEVNLRDPEVDDEVNLQQQFNSQEKVSLFSSTIDTASDNMKHSEDALENGTSIEGTNSKSIDGS